MRELGVLLRSSWGCHCGMGLTPGPRTSTCHRHDKKKKKDSVEYVSLYTCVGPAKEKKFGILGEMVSVSFYLF